MPTVKEMKTKWCPFVRIGAYAGDGAVSVNRGVGDHKGGAFDFADTTRCLADGCAMWVAHTGNGSQGDCGLKRVLDASSSVWRGVRVDEATSTAT